MDGLVTVGEDGKVSDVNEQMCAGSGLWPLAASRSVSLALGLLLAARRRAPLRVLLTSSAP